MDEPVAGLKGVDLGVFPLGRGGCGWAAPEFVTQQRFLPVKGAGLGGRDGLGEDGLGKVVGSRQPATTKPRFLIKFGPTLSRPYRLRVHPPLFPDCLGTLSHLSRFGTRYAVRGICANTLGTQKWVESRGHAGLSI